MKNTGDAAGLAQLISSHARTRLGHFPTPLEPLKRLSEWLGGPSVWVKRDDASGMGQGGNKVRALEFVIPEALATGADILLTAGVVQSNSVRQVAAAAAKTGLDCHFAMITDRVGRTDSDYARTGNVFLDHLYGATHEIISVRDDRAAARWNGSQHTFAWRAASPTSFLTAAPTDWARSATSMPPRRSQPRPKRSASP
jgi:L-cysteate sulfo-lyase